MQDAQEEITDSQDLQYHQIRRITNKYSLLLQIVIIFIFGILLAYCIYNGDIMRIINGYDNYGNVCGVKNIAGDVETTIKMSLDGTDMRQRPYFVVLQPQNHVVYKASLTGIHSIDAAVTETISTLTERVCIIYCWVYPGLIKHKNRCVPMKGKGIVDVFFGKTGVPNFFAEVAEDLEQSWRHILYLQIAAGGFSFLFTVLLTVFTSLMFWLILIAGILTYVILLSTMWYFWLKQDAILSQKDYIPSKLEIKRRITYLTAALIFTAFAFLLIFLIIKIVNGINVILKSFKFTNEIIKAIPLMPIITFLTGIMIGLNIAIFWYFSLWIESAGFKIVLRLDFIIFIKNYLMIITRYYNVFMLFWMIELIKACQRIVIASIVSTWYFHKNEDNVRTPIFRAFYILLRYHLGSAVLGSLLIVLTSIPRILLSCIQVIAHFYQSACGIVNCCPVHSSNRTYNALSYINTKAFNEIVLRGTDFAESGKRAAVIEGQLKKLITEVENSVYLFVVFVRISIVAMAVAAATVILQSEESYQHFGLLLMWSGFISFLLTSSSVMFYQMIIEAALMCIYEDLQKNDRISNQNALKIFKEFIQYSRNKT